MKIIFDENWDKFNNEMWKYVSRWHISVNGYLLIADLDNLFFRIVFDVHHVFDVNVWNRYKQGMTNTKNVFIIPLTHPNCDYYKQQLFYLINKDKYDFVKSKIISLVRKIQDNAYLYVFIRNIVDKIEPIITENSTLWHIRDAINYFEPQSDLMCEYDSNIIDYDNAEIVLGVKQLVEEVRRI